MHVFSARREWHSSIFGAPFLFLLAEVFVYAYERGGGGGGRKKLHGVVGTLHTCMGVTYTCHAFSFRTKKILPEILSIVHVQLDDFF